MSEKPTVEEMAAARERYEAASAAMDQSNKAHIKAAAEFQAAGWVWIRLCALNRDLDEMLLDALTHYQWRRPGATLTRLAEHTYRDVATVRATLAELIATGKVRQVGKAYEVTA